MGKRIDPREYAHRLEVVRQLYPTTPGRQIDRANGWGIGAAHYIALKEGIRHTAEYDAKIIGIKRQNFLKAQTDEVHTRAIATRERRRRLDTIRILSGDEPKYNFRRRAMPRRTYHARWYLIKSYGFTPSDTDLFTLYYDNTLLRRIESLKRKVNFDYYARRYALSIRPLPRPVEEDVCTGEAHGENFAAKPGRGDTLVAP